MKAIFDNIIEKEDCYVVYSRKIKIGVVTKRGERIMFGDNGPLKRLARKFSKKKREVKKRKPDSDEHIAGCQLMKAFNKEKIAFYKNSKVLQCEEGDFDFSHFIAAAKLVTTHGTSNKVFIKAQVNGLKFANKGKGVFPKPKQLSTPGAETRLLEYLSKDVNEDGNEVDVVLSFKEKATSLSDNGKYQSFKRKLDTAEASMWEAIYVKQCQIARRGNASEDVESYIEFLKDEASNGKEG